MPYPELTGLEVVRIIPEEIATALGSSMLEVITAVMPQVKNPYFRSSFKLQRLGATSTVMSFDGYNLQLGEDDLATVQQIETTVLPILTEVNPQNTELNSDIMVGAVGLHDDIGRPDGVVVNLSDRSATLIVATEWDYIEHPSGNIHRREIQEIASTEVVYAPGEGVLFRNTVDFIHPHRAEIQPNRIVLRAVAGQNDTTVDNRGGNL